MLFYAERLEARRAATKFASVWHGADALLIVAALLLVGSYGAGDLAGIVTELADLGLTWAASLAIALFVAAATLKGSAVGEMLSDCAVMQDQSRGCIR